jgi:hypothetical protein
LGAIGLVGRLPLLVLVLRPGLPPLRFCFPALTAPFRFAAPLDGLVAARTTDTPLLPPPSFFYNFYHVYFFVLLLSHSISYSYRNGLSVFL